MISIQNIDHVVFRVVDLQRMMVFYKDVLGARFERQEEDLGLYQLRVGSSLVDLIPINSVLGSAGGAPPGREGRNVEHVCFRVRPWNPQEIANHLAQHGIGCQIEQRYGADGYGPSIYITDPEGNILELKGPPQS